MVDQAQDAISAGKYEPVKTLLLPAIKTAIYRSPDVAKSDRKPMVFKIEDYLREIGLQSKGERRSLYSIMQRPLPQIDDETEAELRSLETLFEYKKI
ncbi:hypothetical protein [Microcoleus sp.]|uniref:hypothetical protein n=1 Tax=Microcoleus sp. TaxID=44472 RepID=UPI00352567F4